MFYSTTSSKVEHETIILKPGQHRSKNIPFPVDINCGPIARAIEKSCEFNYRATIFIQGRETDSDLFA